MDSWYNLFITIQLNISKKRMIFVVFQKQKSIILPEDSPIANPICRFKYTVKPLLSKI